MTFAEFKQMLRNAQSENRELDADEVHQQFWALTNLSDHQKYNFGWSGLTDDQNTVMLEVMFDELKCFEAGLYQEGWRAA